MSKLCEKEWEKNERYLISFFGQYSNRNAFWVIERV